MTESIKRDPRALIEEMALNPRRSKRAAITTIEQVKREFALPVTSPANDRARMAMDAAFDSAGGFSTIYGTLQQHATELGQYPMTSFVGYGALQQIAQNGLIRAAVQTVADDMTRKWIELEGGDDASEKLAELTDLMEHKYRLREVFHRAFETCGYMGGSFVYIKPSKANDLTLPLAVNDMSAELDKDGSVQFIVVDPVNVSPSMYNCNDPLADDYMQPKEWLVLGHRVHHTRMLAVIDNPPPEMLKPSYNFLGIPQAQILWDYVLHFNDTRYSTARLLNKLSLLVVQTDMDAALSDPQGLEVFDAKMDFLNRYRTNDSVFVCDKEAEAVSNVQTTITGATDVVRQSLEMVAAINRTPAVKLLGISPSGFNATGESDIRNYYDYVHSKQELHHDLIQRCIDAIQLVEYGKIDPAIGFKFVPLDEENSASQAMTASTKAQALTALLDRQAISAEELRDVVRADPIFGLENLPEEMPEMPEQQEQFAPGEEGGGNMFEGLAAQGQNPAPPAQGGGNGTAGAQI